MENLENLIRKNAHQLDIYEPNKDHFDRFKKKISKPDNSKNIKMVILLAASFLILFSLSFLFTTNSRSDALPQLSDMSAEYQEVEFFYQVELSDKLSELKTISCKQTLPDTTFYNELLALNQEYTNLQRDLATTDNDERIVNAMISNYQIRINLLETVIISTKKYCF